MYQPDPRLVQRRKVAESLLAQPIRQDAQNPWQTVADSVVKLVGGYWRGQDAEQERQERAAYSDNLNIGLRDIGGAFGLGERDMAALENAPLEERSRFLTGMLGAKWDANAPMTAQQAAAAKRADAELSMKQDAAKRAAAAERRAAEIHGLKVSDMRQASAAREEERKYLAQQRRFAEDAARGGSQIGLGDTFAADGSIIRYVRDEAIPADIPKITREDLITGNEKFDDTLSKETAQRYAQYPTVLSELSSKVSTLDQMRNIASNPEFDAGPGIQFGDPLRSIGDGLEGLVGGGVGTLVSDGVSHSINTNYDRMQAGLSLENISALPGPASDKDIIFINSVGFARNSANPESLKNALDATSAYIKGKMQLVIIEQKLIEENVRIGGGHGALTAQQNAALAAAADRNAQRSINMLDKSSGGGGGEITLDRARAMTTGEVFDAYSNGQISDEMLNQVLGD